MVANKEGRQYFALGLFSFFFLRKILIAPISYLFPGNH
jgi:hypothetical protein